MGGGQMGVAVVGGAISASTMAAPADAAGGRVGLTAVGVDETISVVVTAVTTVGAVPEVVFAAVGANQDSLRAQATESNSSMRVKVNPLFIDTSLNKRQILPANERSLGLAALQMLT
jgi:hypothetical protein